MLSTPKSSRFLGQIFFTKNEAIALSKIRIIKKNLVHVHGFPQSLASIEKLSQFEYFGQYGNIVKTLLTFKTNPDTNKRTYSAYITYSNEKEAAFAILSVDSLLVEGKIIRAFFGTTKYCNYFLNNSICPNLNKCMFLHQLVKDRDIIIDSNTIFSYNEHLNLAKKIIQFSNKETRNLVNSIPKMKKTVFPGIDFIFLNEQEKENYLKSSDISYIKSNYDNDDKEISININNNPKDLRNGLQNNEILNPIKNSNHNEYSNKNNSIEDSYTNLENDIKSSNLLNSSSHLEKSNNFINSIDPLILHNIFEKSISHILKVKPFFYNIRNNIPLKEMELDYLKKELNKNGNNFYSLLDGCLDCVNDNNTL
jgi:hypothetical protein